MRSRTRYSYRSHWRPADARQVGQADAAVDHAASAAAAGAGDGRSAGPAHRRLRTRRLRQDHSDAVLGRGRSVPRAGGLDQPRRAGPAARDLLVLPADRADEGGGGSGKCAGTRPSVPAGSVLPHPPVRRPLPADRAGRRGAGRRRRRGRLAAVRPAGLPAPERRARAAAGHAHPGRPRGLAAALPAGRHGHRGRGHRPGRHPGRGDRPVRAAGAAGRGRDHGRDPAPDPGLDGRPGPHRPGPAGSAPGLPGPRRRPARGRPGRVRRRGGPGGVPAAGAAVPGPDEHRRPPAGRSRRGAGRAAGRGPPARRPRPPQRVRDQLRGAPRLLPLPPAAAGGAAGPARGGLPRRRPAVAPAGRGVVPARRRADRGRGARGRRRRVAGGGADAGRRARHREPPGRAGLEPARLAAGRPAGRRARRRGGGGPRRGGPRPQRHAGVRR